MTKGGFFTLLSLSQNPKEIKMNDKTEGAFLFNLHDYNDESLMNRVIRFSKKYETLRKNNMSH